MVAQNSSIKRLAGVTATSVGICFLLSLVGYYFNHDAFTSVAVSFLVAALYYLLASNKYTANDLFHPYSFFIYYFGIISFALPAMVVAVDDELVSTGMGGGELLSIEHLGMVSFMVAAFFIVFAAAYKLPLGRKFAWMVPLVGFSKRRFSRKQYISTAVVLYGIGWVARMMSFALGYHHMNADYGESLTMISSVLLPLSDFAKFSFIVLLWDRFSNSRSNFLATLFSPTVLLLIGLEVMAGMLTGSRSRMIFPLVYVALVYNYTFSRFKWRHVILGVVVLVFILAPLTTLYRAAYDDVLDVDGASLEGARESLGQLSDSTSEWEFENQILRVVDRLSSSLQGVMVVYTKVPSQIAYAEGETFFPSGFVNIVPRIFWPDKPFYFPGRDFAQIFWNAAVGELYATNMEINWIGEAYYNFGWLGIFLAVPLGVILRFFTERLGIYSRIEVNMAPRIYFSLFVVPVIGMLHYYPGNLLRGALFTLVYLSILNNGIPRVLRLKSRDVSRRRLAGNPETLQ